MHSRTYLGLAMALVAVVGLLLHARSERPGFSSGNSQRLRPLKGTPWVLVLHPIVLFAGFYAYQGGQELVSSGPAGLAAWGVLWPVAAETASSGRPYRIARLLRHYLDYQWVLPFTAEYKRYSRKMRPLRPSERKLVALVLPVILVGAALTNFFSGASL